MAYLEPKDSRAISGFSKNHYFIFVASGRYVQSLGEVENRFSEFECHSLSAGLDIALKLEGNILGGKGSGGLTGKKTTTVTQGGNYTVAESENKTISTTLPGTQMQGDAHLQFIYTRKQRDPQTGRINEEESVILKTTEDVGRVWFTTPKQQ